MLPFDSLSYFNKKIPAMICSLPLWSEVLTNIGLVLQVASIQPYSHRQSRCDWLGCWEYGTFTLFLFCWWVRSKRLGSRRKNGGGL